MAIIEADSANQSDVQDAIDAASSEDTVEVPADSKTWNGSVTSTKALNLRGAGTGQTNITSGIDNQNTPLLYFSPIAAEINKTFELMGFSFDGADKSRIFWASPPSTSPLTGLKVHNNEFNNGKSRAVTLTGLESGVFYSNVFSSNYISIFVGGAHKNGWDWTLAPGSANYPYFEDNVFNHPDTGETFVVMTGQGGRICFRHNIINDGGIGIQEIWDAHGVNGVYNEETSRGTVGVEYYENDIDLAENGRVFNHRGGMAIVFNNDVVGGYSGYMVMTEYQGWSYCTVQGYPKYDQVNESYYYGNTLNGGALTSDSAGLTGCDPEQSDDDYIQLSRDFFRINPVGQTILGEVYSPYTYPHPLRDEAVGGVAFSLSTRLRFGT